MGGRSAGHRNDPSYTGAQAFELWQRQEGLRSRKAPAVVEMLSEPLAFVAKDARNDSEKFDKWSQSRSDDEDSATRLVKFLRFGASVNIESYCSRSDVW